jgi:hypothetical protein
MAAVTKNRMYGKIAGFNRRWMKNGENSLQGTLSQTSYNLPMKAYNRNSVLSSQKLSTK